MRSALAVLLLLLTCTAAGADLPSFEQVKARYRPSEAWLLDRHGQPLQQLRVDPAVRRLEWVPLEQVSAAMRHAIVLSEDKGFYDHSGVDWSAVAAAAWRNLWNERTRGASTVTMQLAALLDPALARGAGGRSLSGKWDQMRAAKALEAGWKKDQILETYLNLVSFRGEVVGIGAVSQAYFGKHPAGLDRRESALAAVLVRAPNAKPELVARRACGLLRAQAPDAACDGLAATARAYLSAPRPVSPAVSEAPHLARRLLTKPGERVVSTLDGPLQRYVRETLRWHLRELAGRNVEDGAVLVIDNASGDVLAWVGGSGELSDSPELDATTALRQAGSTLKPFLYALAVEGKWVTAASILDDSPLNLATAAGLYVPQNYDRSFRGPVSVRAALGASMNVPAVRTLVMVTPEAFHARLRSLGFDSLQENGDYYGYSLALGAADVSLAMLANAYRALANGGRFAPMRTVATDSRTVASRRAIDPRAAYVVTDILSDRNARVGTFGLGSTLETPQWSAVKTGTSKDMRDNWCVGFDDRFTVAVWVGNLSGAPMWDVSGVTGAAPVWQAIMTELQRGRRVVPPPAPRGVVRERVEFDDGTEPPREEVFVAGTEVTLVRAASRARNHAARIAYPGHGTVVALDPDIPPTNQALVFAVHGGSREALVWRLDGKVVGRADQATRWLPWPGRHRLALVDGSGRELDAVQFEVRGAVPKRVALP